MDCDPLIVVRITTFLTRARANISFQMSAKIITKCYFFPFLSISISVSLPLLLSRRVFRDRHFSPKALICNLFWLYITFFQLWFLNGQALDCVRPHSNVQFLFSLCHWMEQIYGRFFYSSRVDERLSFVLASYISNFQFKPFLMKNRLVWHALCSRCAQKFVLPNEKRRNAIPKSLSLAQWK